MRNRREPTVWTRLNQRYLYELVTDLRAQLTVKPKETETPPDTTVRLKAPDWPADQPPPALMTLCRLLNLSGFERDILLLCTAIELDPAMAQLYAARQGSPPRPYPTLQLALSHFPGKHWNALTPAAPLRYWQLVDATGDEPLMSRPLKLDERILHYLMGVTYLDPQIETYVIPLSSPAPLPPSYQALSEQIVAEWTEIDAGHSLVNLYGSTVASREAIATAACEQKGARLYTLDLANLPPETPLRNRFQRRWERESALVNRTILIELSDLSLREKPAFLEAFIQRQQAKLILSSDEPLKFASRKMLRLAVSRPPANEQMKLWKQALGIGRALPREERIALESVPLGSIISQFDLDPTGIDQVGRRIRAAHSEGQATENAENTIGNTIGEKIWDACRLQARMTLDDLAQRLNPVATWDDLVLPAAQMQTLKAVVASVQQRSQVYETWGFGQKNNRGLGISALFAGSSGTGKTMSAEVIAQALGLDLYRIDLSGVVSKYIGETEKNLRRIFDAAEQGGVILLFDEADALFGKRSEVKDSHDRHANIEVSYLLQRMESYRGLAILTTNFKNALDPAFLRRIRFVVSFPFPDLEQRTEMWQRVFPVQTPTEGLNAEKLARLTVPGGNIHSIAMNAAFLASAEASPITMHHLLRSAQSEYGKLDKKLTDAEVRGWI